MSRLRGSSSEPALHLRLYVTGATARSIKAIANLRALREQHLGHACKVEIIDIYQQPELGRAEQIIATPTLVKCSPGPCRRWVGDLSDPRQIVEKLAWPRQRTELQRLARP